MKAQSLWPWESLRRMWEFTRDPIRLMNRLHAQSGDFVELKLGVKRVFLLFHPSLVQALLKDQAQDFRKSRLVFDKIVPLTGSRGLVQLEGEMGREHRQLTSPSVSTDALNRALPCFEANTRSAIAEIRAHCRAGRAFELSSVINRLVLENALGMVLGRTTSGTEEEGRELVEIFIRLNERCGQGIRRLLPLPGWLPTPANREIRALVARLDEILLAWIASRREKGESTGSDLLSLLLQGPLRDNPRQIRDHLATYLFAGYETTATSILMTLHCLSRNPGIACRVREEARALAESAPTVSLLRGFRETLNAYQEALRLYPPSWTLAREAVRDTWLGGQTHLPRGSLIFVGLPQLHRRADFWDEPERFNPDRFNEGPRHPFVYLPFGGGSRICVGMRAAMTEATLVLAMLLSEFDFEAVDPGEPVLKALITAHPAQGIRVRARERVPSRQASEVLHAY